MKTESAKFNENVLIGLDASEPSGEKIGVRLIAGLIARRIVPWVPKTTKSSAATASASSNSARAWTFTCHCAQNQSKTWRQGEGWRNGDRFF